MAAFSVTASAMQCPLLLCTFDFMRFVEKISPIYAKFLHEVILDYPRPLCVVILGYTRYICIWQLWEGIPQA